MSRPEKLRQSLPELGRVAKRFWPKIRQERPLIGVSLAALLSAVGLQLLEPWPLKFVFDRIIPVEKPAGLGEAPLVEGLGTTTLLSLAAAAIVLLTALRAVAEYYNRVGFAVVGNRILTALRHELYCHLQALPLSFHNKSRSGELVIRVISDVTRLKDVVVTALLPLVASLLILVGMVTVMFLLEWRLALVAVGVIPLFGLTTVRLSRRIHQVATKQRERQGAMAAAAAESFGAMKTIQTLSLEETFATDFSSRNQKEFQESVKGARLAARLERTVDVFVAVATAVVVWYGASLVLGGRLTPGDLLVFLTYLKKAFRPAQDFAKYSGRISKAAASGQRVLELLDRTPEICDLPGAARAPAFRGEIRFEQVGFAYEPGHPVLDRLDFELRPGEHVALVGPSGIGKSTVIHLLLRLYDPQEGRILIDGTDIRQYTLASLRGQISVVLQDNLLFAANVWDNIAYGAAEVGEENVLAAAVLANADAFIRALPQGYDTVLGERGVTLSHGQRQRIAIARAAVRRAPILVFDEPGTGLDEENEHAVMDALDRLAAGNTTLLVTHDLRHASLCDRILYLERGRVLESGTHAELLAFGGRYRALYQLQAAERVRTSAKEQSHAVS